MFSGGIKRYQWHGNGLIQTEKLISTWPNVSAAVITILAPFEGSKETLNDLFLNYICHFFLAYSDFINRLEKEKQNILSRERF